MDKYSKERVIGLQRPSQVAGHTPPKSGTIIHDCQSPSQVKAGRRLSGKPQAAELGGRFPPLMEDTKEVLDV